MKKLLSLVLALSLIISVAPMSFAEDAAVEEPIDKPGMYFNFNAEAFGSSEIITAATIKENGDAAEPVYASVNTDPWYIDGQSQLTDFCLTGATADTTTYANSRANALWWKIAKGVRGTRNSGFVIRLKINETGVFAPTISFRSTSSSNAWRFFLGPVALKDKNEEYTFENDDSIIKNYPISVAFSDSTRDSRLLDLGKIDFYAKSAKNSTYTGNNITINKTGEYYLYVVANGVGNSNLPGTKIDPLCMNIYSLNLTPVPAKDLADAAFTATQDSDYVSSNSASIAAYAVCGAETPESLSAPSVNYGETCELEAPLTKTVGETTYNFLYWARGLNASSFNKIVSCENKFTYRPSEGVNYLIAVYEEKNASTDKIEFYNGNGERMTDVSLDDAGNLPELPSMAGYGKATGWKLHQADGNGDVYEAGEAAPTSGTRIFVAQYDDPEENITITINGEVNTYAYGDVATCRSDDANFSYWEKTINGKKQIVSIDKTYTFNAWENCTVNAVCNGTFDLGRAARKVLLGTFTIDNQTAVMAEFVGFGNVFEKGLVLDGNEISMQSGENQFTITNDTDSAVTVEGYAILDESGTTVKYTDGSLTVSGVASAAE